MNTPFAEPERISGNELDSQIRIVSGSPVMTGLLHSVSGLLAVLNERRQVLALNESFLKLLGIDDPAKALGLRPGEALQCIHAREEPTGCGTAKLCATCGAAIAIVSSLKTDQPVERMCVLAASEGGQRVDMTLLVKSSPIVVENRKFLLLFIQDITRQQQWAALERTFFHDVNNMLSMLAGSSQMLVEEQPSELSIAVNETSKRLLKEVAIQQCLARSETRDYQPTWISTTTEKIYSELQGFFANHPVARQKKIECQVGIGHVSLTTDTSLLSRILSNMILNALEATEDGGRVRVWHEQEEGHLSFCVWNEKKISEDVAGRMFQRDFSTKGDVGRGVGTFSMKLFGENVLGGKVSFASSEETGTVFRLSLPV